ncbi:hypothetical protein BDV95DRAFT_267530 [Massariosphaeria phaeospora]|uniref:Uncharacterized protein n=1 Tax=Massariosphaeria phaeospora TaxID=100035 RepID=A0A7C8I0T6_9PLEO|nr:hypothetical protein BDV95DRAFT_267530 [Massariosphaeria phaeospora]
MFETIRILFLLAALCCSFVSVYASPLIVASSAVLDPIAIPTTGNIHQVRLLVTPHNRQLFSVSSLRLTLSTRTQTSIASAYHPTSPHQSRTPQKPQCTIPMTMCSAPPPPPSNRCQESQPRRQVHTSTAKHQPTASQHTMNQQMQNSKLGLMW